MNTAPRLTQQIIVIAGATGVGKTAAAVALAKRLGSEIVNADSMQVYRYLSIGTAKPTAQELDGVPCYLIDHVDPDYQYNMGDFLTDAIPIVERLLGAGKCPIVCGGTGLYLKGLLHGVFETFTRDEAVRAELRRRRDTEGAPALHAELQRVDPVAAARIKPNDGVRIERALEVWYATGKRISDLQEQGGASPTRPARYFVLSRPREEICARIDARVDAMMKGGLLDEVREYLRLGYGRGNPAVRALGYDEMIDFLEGKCTLETAVEAMKLKSRRYAKRQMTWFRGVPYAEWIDVTAEDTAVTVAEKLLRELEKKNP